MTPERRMEVVRWLRANAEESDGYATEAGQPDSHRDSYRANAQDAREAADALEADATLRADLAKAKELERELRMSLAELARRFRERTTDEQRCHDEEFLWSIDEMLR